MQVNKIICGDAVSVLKTMPDESVHCVVTSPPFWGLRAYGTEPRIWGGKADCEHEWNTAPPRRTRKTTDVKDVLSKQATNPGANIDLLDTNICSLCGAWHGELGLEPTPELYVQHLVEIFREVRRVLRKDGTLWLNMGDCYASNWGAGAKRKSSWWSTASGELEGKGWGTVETTIPPNMWCKHPTIKPKDLIGMPWRVAFALQADGWWLRMDNIWAKPNPMPESVRDRPTKSHEYVFLLTKSARYYYDQEAIREPARDHGIRDRSNWSARVNAESYGQKPNMGGENGNYADRGRNARSVWTIATQPFPEAHFATFPEKLVEPCIKAGTSEKGCCPKCGAGWVRILERSKSGSWHNHTKNLTQGIGWRPSCECDAGEPIPCVVADFFCGSGTTPKVAKYLGRDYFASDLNPEYVEMANRRLAEAMPFFEEENNGF